MAESQTAAQTQQQALAALYEQMRPAHLRPLWEVLHGLVIREPASRAMPARWHYAEVRSHLLRAGELISAEQAERRVLIMENPGLPGESAVTPLLYAGLQLILPGETARCHRHSQAALRFIMEGAGAYTAVNGEKAVMRPFDLILTPSWCWHDHGNPSAEPMIWLDGLDIPMVRALDAQFAERMEALQYPETAPSGTTQKLYGRSLRPVRTQQSSATRPPARAFHFPYSEWRDSLQALANTSDPDLHTGHALEFVDSATGGAVMPTISAYVRLLPAGFESRPRRATEGAVVTVVEGRGEVQIDDVTIALNERDVIAIPSWNRVRWKAASELVLFVFSDRGVQEKLCLYRESCE